MARIPTGPRPSQMAGVIGGAASRMEARESRIARTQMAQEELAQRQEELRINTEMAAADRESRRQKFEFDKARANVEMMGKHGQQVTYEQGKNGSPGKYVASKIAPSEEERASSNRMAVIESAYPGFAQKYPDRAKALAASDMKDSQLEERLHSRYTTDREEESAINGILQTFPDLGPDEGQTVTLQIKGGMSSQQVQKGILDGRTKKQRDEAMDVLANPMSEPEAKRRAKMTLGLSPDLAEDKLQNELAKRRIEVMFEDSTELKHAKNQLAAMEKQYAFGVVENGKDAVTTVAAYKEIYGDGPAKKGLLQTIKELKQEQRERIMTDAPARFFSELLHGKIKPTPTPDPSAVDKAVGSEKITKEDAAELSKFKDDNIQKLLSALLYMTGQRLATEKDDGPQKDPGKFVQWEAGGRPTQQFAEGPLGRVEFGPDGKPIEPSLGGTPSGPPSMGTEPPPGDGKTFWPGQERTDLTEEQQSAGYEAMGTREAPMDEPLTEDDKINPPSEPIDFEEAMKASDFIWNIPDPAKREEAIMKVRKATLHKNPQTMALWNELGTKMREQNVQAGADKMRLEKGTPTERIVQAPKEMFDKHDEKQTYIPIRDQLLRDLRTMATEDDSKYAQNQLKELREKHGIKPPRPTLSALEYNPDTHFKWKEGEQRHVVQSLDDADISPKDLVALIKGKNYDAADRALDVMSKTPDIFKDFVTEVEKLGGDTVIEDYIKQSKTLIGKADRIAPEWSWLIPDYHRKGD